MKNLIKSASCGNPAKFVWQEKLNQSADFNQKPSSTKKSSDSKEYEKKEVKSRLNAELFVALANGRKSTKEFMESNMHEGTKIKVIFNNKESYISLGDLNDYIDMNRSIIKNIKVSEIEDVENHWGKFLTHGLLKANV